MPEAAVVQNRQFIPACHVCAILNSATNATTLCKNLVKIGPVVSVENILIEIALPADVVGRRISSNISGCTGPIFAIFSPYETLYVPMMARYCIFEFLKGRCYGNQLKSKNRPISFVALPFQNRLQYVNSDFKILNRMNFSTLYAILMTFDPITPEIARVTTALCWTRQRKSAYPTEYLSNY